MRPRHNGRVLGSSLSRETFLKSLNGGSDLYSTYPFDSNVTEEEGECREASATVGTKLSSGAIFVDKTEEALMEALFTVGPIAVVRIISIQHAQKEKN